MLDRVLVPLDGSETSERVLIHVRALTDGLGSDVVLVRVVPAKTGEASSPSAKQALLAAGDRLEKVRAELARDGVLARARLLEGDPAEKVLELAREIRPSLVAMTTHGRSGVSRFLRGSVAERVLRGSSFPVLLVNPHDDRARRPGEVRRILVPLDLSEVSARVLPLAAAFARAHGAELVLFHSQELAVFEDPVVAVSPVVTREEVSARLERLAERIADVPVRSLIALGAPSIAILDAARAESADLVAMTTHGRSGLSRWAFGSVAENVIRHCACPLLVVRAEAAADGEPFASVERAGDALA